MGFNEIFMGYDKWFNYNGFNKKHYNNSTVHMLYRDRLMIYLMSIIVLIVVIIFASRVIPILLGAIKSLGG